MDGEVRLGGSGEEGVVGLRGRGVRRVQSLGDLAGFAAAGG
jgi:hypothetical protein